MTFNADKNQINKIEIKNRQINFKFKKKRVKNSKIYLFGGKVKLGFL